jgi:hypothetical protein
MEVSMISESNLAEQIVKELESDGFSDQEILDFLEDGEAMAAYGLTDEDQTDVENAHGRIQKEMT